MANIQSLRKVHSLDKSSNTVFSASKAASINYGDTRMKRNFNFWSLLLMCFCTSVTCEAICSVMAQSLTSGGRSSTVWGFIVSATGTLTIALSLSEFSSMIPTAGGQYHYVAGLSPPAYRRVLSWYAGWISMWAWILCTTSGAFALAMQINAYAILFHPDYIYERWHTSLIVIALCSLFTAISIFGIRMFPKLMITGMIFHCAGYIATMAYLLVKVNPKNSAQWVFTDTTNRSCWENTGVAWSIGLLASALGFVGWDSSTHGPTWPRKWKMHRETFLARVLWGSIAISGVLTLPFVIALMFCITDLDRLLSGPVSRMAPLVQLFYNVSGGNHIDVVFMTIFFAGVSCTAGPSCISATSRIIWSFAREKGLPAPLARVDSHYLVPVNALIITWFAICAISLVYIGNETAFYSIGSGVTAAMLFSYAMPVAINLLWGYERNGLIRGPFSMGRYGKLVHLAAMLWSTYLIVFLCFPTLVPITTANMNYSCVVLMGPIFMASIWWFIYGKENYLGVLLEINGESL